MIDLKIKRNTKSGFTFIELMVVFSIIALLSSIIIASLSDARTKAENANVQTTAYQYVLALNRLALDSNDFPITSNGPFCLGGSDCSYTSDVNLNTQFAQHISGAPNPNQSAVFFDGAYRKAAYLRCDNGESCPNDSITEILWFMQGTRTSCGYGADAYYDEGNTACLLHLRGNGTLINEALLNI